MANDDHVYEEYLKLRYELTSDLKILTENVNRLSDSVEKRFDSQEEEIRKISNKLQGSQGAKSNEGSSSLPSKEKFVLTLVLSIAFLGCLGAAIGINLLEYFKLPA